MGPLGLASQIAAHPPAFTTLLASLGWNCPFSPVSSVPATSSGSVVTKLSVWSSAPGGLCPGPTFSRVEFLLQAHERHHTSFLQLHSLRFRPAPLTFHMIPPGHSSWHQYSLLEVRCPGLTMKDNMDHSFSCLKSDRKTVTR
jgi:hypothetical protein